jgi:hypothetical protein
MPRTAGTIEREITKAKTTYDNKVSQLEEELALVKLGIRTGDTITDGKNKTILITSISDGKVRGTLTESDHFISMRTARHWSKV